MPQIHQTKCDLEDICINCNIQYNNECCYFNEKFKGQKKYCGNCISSGDCNNLKTITPNLEILEKIIRGIKFPAFKIHIPKINIKYIPKIDFGSSSTIKEQLIELKRNGCDAIAISLADLVFFSKENFGKLKPNSNKGIHTIINFNGIIILTTNFDDDLCNFYLHHPKIFLGIITILKPDILTSVDANFYFTLPRAIINLQFARIMELNIKLVHLKIPIIGLIPPHLDCVDRSIEIFYKLGLEMIGLPFLELGKLWNIKENRVYAKRLNRKMNSHPLIEDFATIGISTSRFKDLNFDFYLSKSWLIIESTSYNSKLQRRENQASKFKRLLDQANKKYDIKKKQKKIVEYLVIK